MRTEEKSGLSTLAAVLSIIITLQMASRTILWMLVRVEEKAIIVRTPRETKSRMIQMAASIYK